MIPKTVMDKYNKEYDHEWCPPYKTKDGSWATRNYMNGCVSIIINIFEGKKLVF